MTDTTTSLPITESYWVEPGRFLAGEYPGSFEEQKARQRLSAFLESGITDFIDLTKPDELVPYEPILKELAIAYSLEVSYTRISIQDRSIPSRDTMKHILDTIDNALSEGHKVYLHCWGGVGRTGMTVGCYLIRHGLSGEQALDQIASWWLDMPKKIYHLRSPETDEQVNYIRNWHET